jgi:formamidopyrimidine-DNA glycosylase
MPELPEVEVVKRSLTKKVQNSIIKEVKINNGKLRYHINKKEIQKIIGLKIIKIKRRSKYLLFFFNKDIIMLVHLGMTGKFFFINEKNTKFKTSFYYHINKNDQKHDHVVFYLNKKQKLIYNDVRKFGFIKFLNIKNLNKNSHLSNLGPEPLEKEFTYLYFKNYVKDRNIAVKSIMMDQKFVSGIGNIYANEILFLSKVKPSRKAKNLKDFELKKILKFTKKILKISIKFGGSSIKDFFSENGKKGSFQQYFNVYGKKGDPCTNKGCKNKIIRSIISLRATFYCSNCQK